MHDPTPLLHERLPLPVSSRDVTFKSGERRVVRARNDESGTPYTPERFLIQFPGNWILHAMTIGTRSVFDTPHSGNVFTTDAPPPKHLDWGTIQPGEEVAVTVEYVGVLDDVPFDASFFGTRPIPPR